MPGKRITFKQRVQLQMYIEDPRPLSLSKIAKIIGLNRVTLYKEILKRRISKGSKQLKFLKTKPFPCELLKHFPFCCNACERRNRCAKEMFIYSAYDADLRYIQTKHECCKGPRITSKELEELDRRVSPRVQSGQSLYHIVNSDPNIKVKEETVRRYLKAGYLKAKVIDLPRTVQRKSNDIIIEKRQRVDVSLLNGRMYEDYLIFNKQYPNSKQIQIDTIIGKRNDKKAILTIFEPCSKLQVGIIVNRTSESVNNAILKLLNDFNDIGVKLCDAIITDNGNEFQGLPSIETDEYGVYRFKLFYCDPYASYQKGGCERNHEFFRYIKRKGISLDSLTQFEVDEIFSNINSYKRRSLNGLTPYEVFKARYGLKTLEVLRVRFIEPLNIILKR